MGQTRGLQPQQSCPLPPHSGQNCSRRGRATCLGAGHGAALLAMELTAAPPHPSLPPSSPRPLHKGGMCQRPVQGQRWGGRGRGGGAGGCRLEATLLLGSIRVTEASPAASGHMAGP